jgi:hypothetical protein
MFVTLVCWSSSYCVRSDKNEEKSMVLLSTPGNGDVEAPWREHRWTSAI